jgi:hypothetical protein
MEGHPVNHLTYKEDCHVAKAPRNDSFSFWLRSDLFLAIISLGCQHNILWQASQIHNPIVGKYADIAKESHAEYLGRQLPWLGLGGRGENNPTGIMP